MERLGEWRRKRGLTLAQLGALYGVRFQLAYAHSLDPADPNFKMPRPDKMRRIFLATGGQVAPNDFYDLPELPAREAA